MPIIVKFFYYFNSKNVLTRSQKVYIDIFIETTFSYSLCKYRVKVKRSHKPVVYIELLNNFIMQTIKKNIWNIFLFFTVHLVYNSVSTQLMWPSFLTCHSFLLFKILTSCFLFFLWDSPVIFDAFLYFLCNKNFIIISYIMLLNFYLFKC